jgi:hypothetical protein
LGEIIILLNEIFDLDIPVITEDAILPVPINPKVHNIWLLYNDYLGYFYIDYI